MSFFSTGVGLPIVRPIGSSDLFTLSISVSCMIGTDRNGKSERFHSYVGIPQVRNRNSEREKFSSWVALFRKPNIFCWKNWISNLLKNRIYSWLWTDPTIYFYFKLIQIKLFLLSNYFIYLKPEEWIVAKQLEDIGKKENNFFVNEYIRKTEFILRLESKCFKLLITYLSLKIEAE